MLDEALRTDSTITPRHFGTTARQREGNPDRTSARAASFAPSTPAEMSFANGDEGSNVVISLESVGEVLIFATSQGVCPLARLFSPHLAVPTNRQSAWRIIRSLVVGYIEQDAGEPSAAMEDRKTQETGEMNAEPPAGDPTSSSSGNRKFRVAGRAVMLNNRLFLGEDNLASHESTVYTPATIGLLSGTTRSQPDKCMQTFRSIHVCTPGSQPLYCDLEIP